MNISGANQLHGPHALQGPHSRPVAKATGPQSARPQAVDQLDLSPEALAASEASNPSATGPVRAERVADIRSQIQAGTYETPDKLDAALSRLLDEIG